MQPFHALVKNGRLTLDEPCDLPDGQVVVLLPLEELLAAANGADDDMPLMVRLEPPPREWKEAKAVDAKGILDELRAL